MTTRWIQVLVVLVVLVGSCSSTDTGPTTSSSAPEPVTTSTVPTATPHPPTTTATSAAAPTMTSSTTTSTTSPVPPMLQVTDPLNGTTVHHGAYTFRGVTDPGCTVSVADRYHAKVEADGTWALDLVLHLGDNATTVVATDGNGLDTRTRITVTYQPDLTLRADGLGPFNFGDPLDEVAEGLTALLGPSLIDLSKPPDGDTCWAEVGCLAWDGLYVEFNGAESSEEFDVDHFGGWSTWSGEDLRLATANGIGPGATAGAMAAAFGDGLDWWGDPEQTICCGWRWSVEDPTTGRLLFFGYLSGSEQDPSTTMTWMGSGSTFWNMH